MKSPDYKQVSLFQREFRTLLYVAGTTGSVLIKELGVLVSEVFNREVPP